jgi:O-antigen/teichoic acid export membrane protein
MVATFAASIIFARLLGVAGYGEYVIALAFTATCNTVLNLGQGSSLLIFFAEEHGKKDVAGMSAVVRNYLHVSVVNALVLLALIIISPRMIDIFNWSAIIVPIVQIRLIADIVDKFNSMAIIILQSIREIKSKVLLEQAANLSSVFLSIAAALAGYGVLGIVWAQLIAALIFLPIAGITLVRVRRTHLLPGLHDLLATPWRATAPYLTQGFLFSVDKNIGGVFPNGLFFVMSFIAPASSVAMAKIAVQLSGVPRMILLPQIGDLSTTVLANMRSSGVQTLRTNAARVIKHAMAVFAALTFGGMVASPFIIWLYGPQYLEALPLTLWLMLLSLPAGICVINSPILRLFQRIHVSIILAFVSWIVMIAALFVIGPMTTPIIGFAVAYGIGLTLPCFLTAYIFLFLLRRQSQA